MEKVAIDMDIANLCTSDIIYCKVIYFAGARQQECIVFYAVRGAVYAAIAMAAYVQKQGVGAFNACSAGLFALKIQRHIIPLFIRFCRLISESAHLIDVGKLSKQHMQNSSRRKYTAKDLFVMAIYNFKIMAATIK